MVDARVGNAAREIAVPVLNPGRPEGRLDSLTKVRVKSDEPFEKALRRFKKKCNKEGLMQRIKELKHYEKPSEKRRRRMAKAVARQAQLIE